MIYFKLETFQVTTTTIGERITYSFAKIDKEKGTVDTGNKRTIPVVVDDNIIAKIKELQEYILEKVKEDEK